MKALRFWVFAAVMAAGLSSAQALGRNGFLGQLSDLLTSAHANIADPVQKQSVIDAVAILQTAPGVAEFDNLAPDLKVTGKAIATLGDAANDPNVASAINMFVPAAFANVVGRGAQGYLAAAARLGNSPLSLFKVVQAVAKVQSTIEKAAADPSLTTVKKLKIYTAAAKKHDKLYNKYRPR